MDGKNLYVDKNKKLAVERGVNYLILNTTNYEGSEEVELKILQEYWVMDQSWENYLMRLFTTGILIFVISYTAALPSI